MSPASPARATARQAAARPAARQAVRLAAALASALIVAAAASSLLASCAEPVYEGFDGTIENPTEIPRLTPLESYIGSGYGRNYSYYTFVSDKPNPTVVYEHVWPDDDIDCEVFTNPDFYHDRVAVNEAMSETSCIVQPGDFTGVRLYVKIYNYDDNNDLTYDIYYY